MGVSSIQHNMLMVNANRHMNKNAKVKAASAEKLSSGYKINRAADDAAGLAISEKMRRMVNGLNQGTENAQDGVSWVQIGDGSLEETHAMLHRMTELAIKASTETCTDADRMMMESEFDHLQKEIDRLTDNTYFNEKHVFKEHEYPYYQIEGEVRWPQSQMHKVRAGENDLIITYRQKETDPPKQASITVPVGEYTTRELMDEIDTALKDAGLMDDGIVFEYTDFGNCNLNLEGGEKIDDVSGGLTYLLFDKYDGGTLGALIGTTKYSSPLEIVQNENDTLQFKVIPADGDTSKIRDIEIKLDPGDYSKTKLLQILNQKLQDPPPNGAGTNVIAEEYGTGIMLSSPDYIITEFKGNMFEIDGKEPYYTSVFYDNIHHAMVTYEPAEIQGGGVLSAPSYRDQYGTPHYSTGSDPKNQEFHFNDQNSLLVLNPNGGPEITIDFMQMAPNQKKDMQGVVSFLNQQFAQNSAELRAEVVHLGNPPLDAGNGKFDYRDALRIVSTAKGKEMESSIGINKTKSTAYDVLFTSVSKTIYGASAEFGGNNGGPSTNFRLFGQTSVSGGLNVKNMQNDAFTVTYTMDGKTEKIDVVLAEKNYSGAELAAEIERQLNAHFTGAADVDDKYKDDDGKVFKVRLGTSTEPGLTYPDSNQRGHIVLEGATAFVSNISVSAFSSTNTGYDDIFVGEKRLPVGVPETGRATQIVLPDNVAKVNPDGTVTIDNAHKSLKVKVDGDPEWREVSIGGTWDSYEKLAEHITDKLAATGKPISFETYSVQGTTKTVTPYGAGHVKGGTDSDVGKFIYTKQGDTHRTGPEGETGTRDKNEAPVITFNADLAGEIRITDENKNLNFNLLLGKEGAQTKKEVKINLMDLLPPGQDKFANINDFCAAVQDAVNAQLKVSADSYGGVKVEAKGNRVTLTGGLKDTVDPTYDVDAAKVTIAMDTTKGGFLYALHGVKSEASYAVKAQGKVTNISGSSSSVRNLQPSAAANGETIRITLKQPAGEGGEVTKDVALNGTSSNLQSAVDTAFGANKIRVDTSSGQLKFITIGKGDDYDVTVDEGNSPALGILFGYDQGDGTYAKESKDAAAGKILKKVQSEFTYDSSDNRSMKITVDDQPYEITLDEGVKYGNGQNGTTDIAKAIRDKVNAKAGKQVLSDDCAVGSDGFIYLKTASENGADSKIKAVYDENSAMRKIFGDEPIAGVKAEFKQDANGDYKLQLTRVQDPKVPDSAYPRNKGLYVVSHENNGALQGGAFVLPEIEDVPPMPVSGYDPGNFSYVDGVDLVLNENGNLELDEYNNVLDFYYTDQYVNSSNPASPPTNPKKIHVTMNPGEWDLALLQKTLQAEIDKQTDNKRKLEVTVDPKGVRIQSAKSGGQYRIYTSSDRVYQNYQWTPVGPSGSFYDKVMCQAEAKTSTYNAQEKPGYKSEEGVYAVGRQDIKNHEVKIQKDGNDELSLELSVPLPNRRNPNQDPNDPNDDYIPFKLEMKLDPGYYRGEALVQQIQKQLDKALVDNGLPAGLVEAGIDIIKTATSIVGSLNDRALTFKISDKVQGPVEGRYGIDAIGGTAAYSVFYQTDGDITKAYIKGGKDISQGVEIKPGANDFSVDVDGTTYQITLDAGKYTPEDLAKHITEKFQQLPDPCPLTAMVDDGHIKLMHNQFGTHKISSLSGSIKNKLFFTEKGEKETEDPIHLRLSSSSGDWTHIDRPWMNTVSLGINSLTISKVKYAQKAIGRLKEAVTKAADVRSYFGSKQNRLESTIRNNENKAENTLAADTRLRDTDFGKETVDNSLASIMEQAGASMMAQLLRNTQLALQLLK